MGGEGVGAHSAFGGRGAKNLFLSSSNSIVLGRLEVFPVGDRGREKGTFWGPEVIHR